LPFGGKQAVPFGKAAPAAPPAAAGAKPKPRAKGS
jgi:hypothetical protein